MDRIFKFSGYEFVPKTHALTLGKESLKIRPKTAELLALLISAEGEIVTKETLLKQVWNDVVVDEQVIFQSIKELRKIFNEHDFIKTHPRKGYAWTAPIETQPPSAENQITENQVAGNKYARFWLLLPITLVCLALIWDRLSPNTDTLVTVKHGSVLVMPVTSTLSDTDHRWLRYGAMDELIQSLSSSDAHAILQADDVIEVINRAKNYAPDASNITLANVFQVSGASLIVELTVTGSPSEYQLLYSLNERSDTNKGVIEADSVRDGLLALSNVIRKRLGQEELVDEDYQSSFSNELMALALSQMQEQKPKDAVKFIEAAIAAAPNNLSARRLLAQLLLETGQFDAAEKVTTSALEASQNSSSREVGRLYLKSALSKLQLKDTNSALEQLKNAKAIAKKHKDWLYLAYSHEVSGHSLSFAKNYSEAESEYTKALELHSQIQCPYGQAQGWINLGKLALKQSDAGKAKQYFTRSLDIGNSKNLSDLANDAKQQLDNLTDI